jgi:hypothetical protein
MKNKNYNGKLKPICLIFMEADCFFSTSNGKEVGEISEYPQLNEYQNTAFDYLKNRAINSESAYLKARYNLLLRHSILKKNNSYAKNASINYIATIEECVSKLKEEIEYSYLIGRIIEKW